jgi:hypothetical protein
MKLLILAAASTFLVACSSSPATKSDEVAEQKVYRTGSHIPVRDRNDGSATITSGTPSPVGTPAPAYVPGKGGGGN